MFYSDLLENEVDIDPTEVPAKEWSHINSSVLFSTLQPDVFDFQIMENAINNQIAEGRIPPAKRGFYTHFIKYIQKDVENYLAQAASAPEKEMSMSDLFLLREELFQCTAERAKDVTLKIKEEVMIAIQTGFNGTVGELIAENFAEDAEQTEYDKLVQSLPEAELDTDFKLENVMTDVVYSVFNIIKSDPRII